MFLFFCSFWVFFFLDSLFLFFSICGMNLRSYGAADARRLYFSLFKTMSGWGQEECSNISECGYAGRPLVGVGSSRPLFCFVNFLYCLFADRTNFITRCSRMKSPDALSSFKYLYKKYKIMYTLIVYCIYNALHAYISGILLYLPCQNSFIYKPHLTFHYNFSILSENL